MPPHRSPLLPVLVVLAAALFTTRCAYGQQIRFDIWKGGKAIGSILAERTVHEERTRYVMTSLSEFDLVLKQEVRSNVTADYRHGHLYTCHSQVTVNGSMRDSSHYAPGAEGATCYVHPDERFRHSPPVAWTTSRMYFDEPVGQHSVFVESVLKNCPLKNIAPGRYTLTLPGGKVNTYIYAGGRLKEIHVDRSFFSLVFRRR